MKKKKKSQRRERGHRKGPFLCEIDSLKRTQSQKASFFFILLYILFLVILLILILLKDVGWFNFNFFFLLDQSNQPTQSTNLIPKKKNNQTNYFLIYFVRCIWISLAVSIFVLGCSPKKLFSCQLCGKVLCSKASLKRHIADKHAERQEEYRCIICERVYCSRNSLMTHIYTYHKSRPGDHQLDMKDIKFFWIETKQNKTDLRIINHQS